MSGRSRWLALAGAWLLAPPAVIAQSATTAAETRAAASRDTALRVIISIQDRSMWVVRGESDTLRVAAVAVGSGRTLSGAGQRWTFATPPGVRTVLEKETDPVWIRPDWAYVEVARKNDLRLAYLDVARPRTLSDGSVLTLRAQVVGVLADSIFSPLPLDEEIVFDGTLFVPPMNSANRRISGELGRYRLKLGDGIGLHGTPDRASVGRAVTHGCLRLRDEDIEWAFVNVPVGTRVYIY